MLKINSPPSNLFKKKVHIDSALKTGFLDMLRIKC